MGHSLQDWLDLVQRDWPDHALNKYNWEVSESLKVSPFAHSENSPADLQPLVADETQQGDWIIGDFFRAKADDDIAALNQLLLVALSEGSSRLFIDLNMLRDPAQSIDGLLKNVHLDMITVCWQIKRSAQSAFENQLADLFSNSQQHHNSSFLLETSSYSLPALVDVALWIDSKPDPVEEMIQLLYSSFQLLAEPLGPEKGIQFFLPINDLYLVNIAKIRAAKLLLQLLQSTCESNFTSVEICTYQAGSDTPIKDEDLIQSTSRSMAAVLGGADCLFMGPWIENEEQQVMARKIRNVQHIMNYESQMQVVKDPAAGSYYLERLTDQIAEQAWSSFKNLI